ncbi:hypothetical protein KR51_00023250 [Rubidibacter lacunae KORDI 51-2]|uniref:Uncharacterized protein n=1 Tax=Rubidibacter lacunae KORDI 51-2 TaxID=582515 RepID=U5D901_9CHRO|nr:ankyrin repeat domain-containing protein [Rubidibacter lacunae]ERN41068.1 hypothetical protein KR51_00023250 [Rubidibacter lacunae KORDI 51-2]
MRSLARVATALMWVAHRRHLEAMAALLQTGRVEVDRANLRGHTALVLAEFNRYPRAVSLLGKAGANRPPTPDPLTAEPLTESAKLT